MHRARNFSKIFSSTKMKCTANAQAAWNEVRIGHARCCKTVTSISLMCAILHFALDRIPTTRRKRRARVFFRRGLPSFFAHKNDRHEKDLRGKQAQGPEKPDCTCILWPRARSHLHCDFVSFDTCINRQNPRAGSTLCFVASMSRACNDIAARDDEAREIRCGSITLMLFFVGAGAPAPPVSGSPRCSSRDESG